jgi:hypothetical protein
MNNRLENLKAQRESLRNQIKNIGERPPVELSINKDGKHEKFILDEAGKVKTTPSGVWSWAAGMGYRDLMKFLEQREIKVEAVF